MQQKRTTPPIAYRIPSPCLRCEKRYKACHDHCEEFAAYRKKLGKIKDAQFAYNVANAIRTTAHQSTYRRKRS